MHQKREKAHVVTRLLKWSTIDEIFLSSIGLVYIYKENDKHVGGTVIFNTGTNLVFRHDNLLQRQSLVPSYSETMYFYHEYMFY